jgi:hypothetical protein
MMVLMATKICRASIRVCSVNSVGVGSTLGGAFSSLLLVWCVYISVSTSAYACTGKSVRSQCGVAMLDEHSAAAACVSIVHVAAHVSIHVTVHVRLHH